MIRSVLRTLLRRQLGEVMADAWEDSDLNTLIDAGCDQVGAMFFAMAPDRAPINVQLNNFVRDAGYQYATIALPAGFTRMNALSLLQSDGTYLEIPKETKELVEGLTTGNDAGWAYNGNAVIVGPAPSVAQANGVRFRYSGGITLATDQSVPPFPSSLHLAVMYEAKAIALGETGDDDTPLQRTLTRLYNKFAGEYLDGGGRPEAFSLDRKSPSEY